MSDLTMTQDTPPAAPPPSMNRAQRILTVTLWATLVLAMVGVVGAGLWTGTSATPSRLPELFDAPAFALVNQDGEPVTDAALEGHPWIAAFIFTQCAGPCPMMSSKMQGLQTAIPDKDVKLVSFSVDPERDTPEVLKEYAAQFKADESRWYFLTGEKKAIYDVVRGMNLVLQDASGDEPILHDTRFLLIDGNGKIRGIYSSDDPEEMKQLPLDAAELAAAK